jgi:tRNA pseudouridine55 synthase
MAPEGDPVPLPAVVEARLAAGCFLLVDKPRGPSSHQVTAWVRDLLGRTRAGHAGTLDPHVSGVLWIGIGPALKLLPLVLEFPKRYVGVMTLHGPVAAPELARALAEFTGPIFQTPPVRSAVARRRRIRTVHRLELLEREGTNLLLDAVVDSGTYLRTLAVDLGDALGVGAHLGELRRTGTGPFTEGAAVALPQLADALASAREGAPDALLALLHPMREVWAEFPRVYLKPGAVAALAHGADLARGGIRRLEGRFARGSSVALVTEEEELVAIGTALADSDHLGGGGWVIDATRVLIDPARYPASWRRPRNAPAGTEPARS